MWTSTTTTSAGLQKVYKVQTRLVASQCMCDEGFVLADGTSAVTLQ